MKLLIIPYNYFHQPVAGGEIYLERLIEYLKTQGHDMRILTGHSEFYVHNGIECHPQGQMPECMYQNSDLYNWCDIIVTQLIGCPMGYNMAYKYQKPLIFIAHNNSPNYPVTFCDQGKLHLIYNSYQLRDDLFKTFGHQNGTVLHPIIPKLARTKKGKFVTLINCNENKGGNVIIELAMRLPKIDFMGVFGGYGDQIEAKLPNLYYLPNGVEMEQVYADTKILIVPSTYESYSQSAMEAMVAGVPVIAHPTPGLKENLGDSGIFVDRNNIDSMVQNIVSLVENKAFYKSQSDKCFDRGNAIAQKSTEELERFNVWLSKIK